MSPCLHLPPPPASQLSVRSPLQRADFAAHAAAATTALTAALAVHSDGEVLGLIGHTLAQLVDRANKWDVEGSLPLPDIVPIALPMARRLVSAAFPSTVPGGNGDGAAGAAGVGTSQRAREALAAVPGLLIAISTTTLASPVAAAAVAHDADAVLQLMALLQLPGMVELPDEQRAAIIHGCATVLSAAVEAPAMRERLATALDVDAMARVMTVSKRLATLVTPLFLTLTMLLTTVTGRTKLMSDGGDAMAIASLADDALTDHGEDRHCVKAVCTFIRVAATTVPIVALTLSHMAALPLTLTAALDRFGMTDHFMAMVVCGAIAVLFQDGLRVAGMTAGFAAAGAVPVIGAVLARAVSHAEGLADDPATAGMDVTGGAPGAAMSCALEALERLCRSAGNAEAALSAPLPPPAAASPGASAGAGVAAAPTTTAATLVRAARFMPIAAGDALWSLTVAEEVRRRLFTVVPEVPALAVRLLEEHGGSATAVCAGASLLGHAFKDRQLRPQLLALGAPAALVRRLDTDDVKAQLTLLVVCGEVGGADRDCAAAMLATPLMERLLPLLEAQGALTRRVVGAAVVSAVADMMDVDAAVAAPLVQRQAVAIAIRAAGIVGSDERTQAKLVSVLAKALATDGEAAAAARAQGALEALVGVLRGPAREHMLLAVLVCMSVTELCKTNEALSLELAGAGVGGALMAVVAAHESFTACTLAAARSVSALCGACRPSRNAVVQQALGDSGAVGAMMGAAWRCADEPMTVENILEALAAMSQGHAGNVARLTGSEGTAIGSVADLLAAVLASHDATDSLRTQCEALREAAEGGPAAAAAGLGVRIASYDASPVEVVVDESAAEAGGMLAEPRG